MRHSSIDPPGSASTGLHRAVRLALLVSLAAYGLAYVVRPGHWGLLDAVDLAVHETGHLVFAPLGEFMGFLGGTLSQLIVPTAFVVYFYRRGERFAAAVPLWWVGQNLLNVSVYVRDARTRTLPLLGGGEHDWAYLLATTGLLRHDQAIANAVHLSGLLVMVGALFVAARETSPSVPSGSAGNPAPVADRRSCPPGASSVLD